jgi:tRNA 2-thiouridine synthesizing protein E
MRERQSLVSGIERDEEGFLLDTADWNEKLAERLAEEEGLELDEHRWLIVRFVRDYFEQRQTVPETRTVLKMLRERLGPEQATRGFMHRLFPYGYGQQACKIAGMRKPRKLMLDV